jgi:hypothetical protein
MRYTFVGVLSSQGYHEIHPKLAGRVNLLCTTAGGFETLEFQEEIAAWRSQQQIIDLLPMERVAAYLHFHPAARLALIDSIVCWTGVSLFAWGPRLDMVPAFELEGALKLAKDVRNLPESCAMRDGRKWRTIPFIIISSPSDLVTPEMRQDTHAHILTRHSHYPTDMLRQVKTIVDEYQDRVLDDYGKVGIIVRFQGGRAQILPGLRRKRPHLETEFYYASADRRNKTGWVTVKRDIEGIRLDVELLQALIDKKANERDIHKFFEEHPAILMEARLGIPISHRPIFTQPKDWTPDFAFSPILGPQSDNEIELMELKGPGERTLSGRVHPGFSAKVHRAIDQVRDYERCLRDPANFPKILEAFGYIPEASRLAVLIGKAPSSEAEREVFVRRQSELDVKVITYDEILQTQASQI